MGNPTQGEVAKRAYQIWEKEGRPHGRDREHWKQAERELAATSGSAGVPALKPAPTAVAPASLAPPFPSLSPGAPRRPPRRPSRSGKKTEKT